MYKDYKKDADYSYSLGAFPTVELVKKRIENVKQVYIHSTFFNSDLINYLTDSIGRDKIVYNDKQIEKLAKKENCFVVGVFSKYNDILSIEEDHIVLDNPANMGNLGTIIRSALGFGISNIAIIKPGVDYFDPKVIRSSMGSIFSVNIQYFTSYEDYQEKYPTHTCYTFMLQAKKDLRYEAFDKHPLSLVFGNEAKGIDLRHLNENSLIINHSNEIDSLNITNAVSIALYEYSEKQKLLNRS